jgi:hypothetical protein
MAQRARELGEGFIQERGRRAARFHGVMLGEGVGQWKGIRCWHDSLCDY